MNDDMGTNLDVDNEREFDLEQARRGTEQEHQLSLGEGLRRYRKAVAWSMLFSLAIIMEGYDKTLLQSFFAFPVFARKYGAPTSPDGEGERYELTAAWQSGLSNGVYVGEIAGLFVTGLVAERVGYRRIMAGAAVSLVAFIFILFFAPNLPTLLVGEILCGVPWGVFQTVTTAYAAEVCPVALRGYLTTYVNLCWVIGQFIATGVLRGCLHRDDEWSYRIPFALQWLWLPFILATVWFGPESPWWLVRKGKKDEARKVLDRLHNTAGEKEAQAQLDNTLEMMVYTCEMEKDLAARQSTHSFADCFKSTDLRRTEITCVTWAIQALCGSSFMGYSTYFYQQAGLDVSQSFNMSLGQYAFGVVGTIFSWVLMTRFGRRSLYIAGLFALTLTLFAVGFTSLADSDSAAASWAIGSLLLVFTFTYDCTVGPVCYSIVAEIPSTQMRAKTIVLARNVYNVFMILNGVIVPRMLNPTAWDWKGKTGFFWAAITVVLFIWAYFRLPESKGRTFAELDILFEKKVGARHFKDTEVSIGDVQVRATE